MNKELINKIIQKAVDLICQADRDEDIYGDSYVEFGERSIKVINPKDVIVNHKSKLSKPYGKSIITPSKNKCISSQND